MKNWMVEQRWAIGGDLVVPVRNVVRAKNRKDAQKGAKAACKAAANALGAEKLGAEPKGKAQVLYPI